jgi:hypothetical protein
LRVRTPSGKIYIRRYYKIPAYAGMTSVKALTAYAGMTSVKALTAYAGMTSVKAFEGGPSIKAFEGELQRE